jgi:hypothetical protein
MTRLTRTRVPQLDTRTPEILHRELGRAQFDQDELRGRLPLQFEQRLRRAPRVTTGTTRPTLNLGYFTPVDTREGAVRLYLPRATPSDAGLSCAFLKETLAGAVHLQPDGGQLINSFTSLDSLTQAGLHRVFWDGAAWWFNEPRSRIRRHVATPGTVGLWQFDGTLADTSGQGNDFTVSAGTIIYSDVMPGLQFAWFDAATTISVSASVLQITGDLTIETLMVIDAGSNGNAWISHGGNGETEALNVLYECQIETGRLPSWFSESGAGVNATYSWATYALPPVHRMFHLAHVREDGVVTNYVNGRQLGESSTALTTPTGGGSGALYVGGNAAGVFGAQMFVGSLKISNRALDADEILVDYNYCMGGAYGFVDADVDD